jgi:hypothetical protein
LRKKIDSFFPLSNGKRAFRALLSKLDFVLSEIKELESKEPELKFSLEKACEDLEWILREFTKDAHNWEAPKQEAINRVHEACRSELPSPFISIQSEGNSAEQSEVSDVKSTESSGHESKGDKPTEEQHPPIERLGSKATKTTEEHQPPIEEEILGEKKPEATKPTQEQQTHIESGGLGGHGPGITDPTDG